MPVEPLGIVGFTMSVINFTVSTRNNIATITKDILAFQDYAGRLQDFHHKLEGWETRMTAWRNLWGVTDGVSDESLRALWGETGSQSINSRLERIKDTCDALG